jgi:hypothetical protein
MNGNYSSSPKKESATGRPDRDPLAAQDDPPSSSLKTGHGLAMRAPAVEAGDPTAQMALHSDSITPYRQLSGVYLVNQDARIKSCLVMGCGFIMLLVEENLFAVGK